MMKRIISIALVFAPVIVFGQTEKFIVAGKIGNLNAPAIIYLRYMDNGVSVKDSAIFRDGKFRFEGTISLPVKALLEANYTASRNSSEVLYIYLEKKVKISALDSLKNATVNGGKLNADWQKFKLEFKPVEERAGDKMIALNKEFVALTADQKKDKDILDQMMKRLNAINSEKKQTLKNFILKNPGSLVSFDLLKSYGGYDPDFKEQFELFGSLTEKVKKSQPGTEYAAVLENMRRISIGAIAPDFTQNDQNGNVVSLASLKGKYVWIDFWASWCKPCKQSFPHMQEIYAKYKSQKLEIIGISTDAERDVWLKTLTETKNPWLQILDNKKIASIYLVSTYPTAYLIDPDGKIIVKETGYTPFGPIEKKLDEIFKN